MPRSAPILLRLLIVAMLALASVAVPRMQVHAAPQGPAAVDLAAYAMPDGTLPELCLTDATSDGDGHHTPPHCFACRLVVAPGILPADPGFDHPLARLAAPVLPVADAPARPHPAWPPNLARAPPPSRSQA